MRCRRCSRPWHGSTVACIWNEKKKQFSWVIRKALNVVALISHEWFVRGRTLNRSASIKISFICYFDLTSLRYIFDEDARKFYLIDNLDNDTESLTTLDATTSKSIFPLKRFSTFSLISLKLRAKFKWITRRHSMTSSLHHHNSFNSCKLFCCHDPSKVSHRTKAEVVIMVKVF